MWLRLIYHSVSRAHHFVSVCSTETHIFRGRSGRRYGALVCTNGAISSSSRCPAGGAMDGLATSAGQQRLQFRSWRCRRPAAAAVLGAPRWRRRRAAVCRCPLLPPRGRRRCLWTLRTADYMSVSDCSSSSSFRRRQSKAAGAQRRVVNANSACLLSETPLSIRTGLSCATQHAF